MAHWLIEQGIGTEDRVAVLLDKSPELVITALGIVKAGAVYLPVDPTYPEDRLAFILGDCDAKWSCCEHRLPDLADYPATDPTDADRCGPLRPEQHRLPDLHLGFDRTAQGCTGAAPPIAEYFVWFGDEYDVDENRTGCCRWPRRASTCRSGEIFGTLALGRRW